MSYQLASQLAISKLMDSNRALVISTLFVVTKGTIYSFLKYNSLVIQRSASRNCGKFRRHVRNCGFLSQKRCACEDIYAKYNILHCTLSLYSAMPIHNILFPWHEHFIFIVLALQLCRIIHFIGLLYQTAFFSDLDLLNLTC